MSEKSDFKDSFGFLEPGLRAGYGRASWGGVLASLEARTESALRLTLPDADDDREPVVKPTRPEHATSMGARYQVLGEIARGGLGVVMKSRDLDLGRDVAVKVLHERFKDDRRVIERFVEEAQIGGQLQHPGIVPVYELGLQADDRPFFAMKLVKGETLAAMLKRRRSPRQDLQRHLREFLQVCQTIAYAHVRRVVHRDLKPSNILVGAFGEVQVVDWGLAKVLRSGGVDDEAARSHGISVIETVRTAEGSSHSLAGSIMGTPGYMSPEQARGEVERMDTRSDVFSLGAVLCEILSGSPPYDADDREGAVRDACECRYEPALRRLAACGADAEMVELTRACLAPARDARPQDAGEVAARVEAYLQSVQDHARRAEVRAAELRVRSRSALLLSALVVVVLVVSGWAYLAWKGQRSERLADTVQRANAAMVEAAGLAGQAEQAGLAGVELWGSALVAARRAAEIVAAGEADEELEVQVAGLLQDVETREASTREEALREESHALWLERILEVRVGPDVPRLDLFAGEVRRRRESTRRSQEYSELFCEMGYDDASSVEDSSRRFACAHRVQFALAFDAWAESERVAARFADEVDPERWRRPIRVARRLDPEDPWRGALRDEIGRDALDSAALRGLARTEALRGRSAEEIAILVALLDAAGDGQGAIETQLEGIVQHPGDFWLSLSLADLCAQEEFLGRIYEKGAEWATRSAAVLRPESRRARFDLALNSTVLRDAISDQILHELRLELPDDPMLQAMDFWLLMETGRFDEGMARIPEHLPALQQLQIDWDNAPFLWSHGHLDSLFTTPGIPQIKRGLLHLYDGRFDEAWAALEAHGEPLRPSWPWIYLPAALEGVGSAEQLRATVERLQRLASADDATMRAAASADLLAATELVTNGWDGPDQVVTLFQHAFANDPASKEIWTGTRARQMAAFAAALASGVGTRAGKPLPPERRAALRRLALDWMHEELDVIERDLSSPEASREMATNYSRVFNQMKHYGWLAPIREPQYLARMAPEEARECRVFWARLRGLEAMLVGLFSE